MLRSLRDCALDIRSGHISLIGGFASATLLFSFSLTRRIVPLGHHTTSEMDIEGNIMPPIWVLIIAGLIGEIIVLARLGRDMEFVVCIVLLTVLVPAVIYGAFLAGRWILHSWGATPILSTIAALCLGGVITFFLVVVARIIRDR